MNKHTKIFIILILIGSTFITSCNRRTMNRRFDEIESTISDNPLLAYQELSDIPSEKLLSPSLRARYALLMSLAMDKSYIDVDDDSLIRIAVDYYQDGKNTPHKMLSLYSLGIVQRNAGKTQAAIISFMRAKEVACELSDYHYLGLINRNIGALYRECHDVDQELRCFRESVLAFEKEGAPRYAEYSRLEEARSLMAKGMYSRADSLLREVEVFARNNDKRLLRQVLMDRAVNTMSSDSQDARLAISLYKEAEEIAGGRKETVDYGTLARAYDMMNNPDSVAHYISLAESSVRTSLDSAHLCNTLALLFTSHGDYKSANIQYEKGIEIHNRLVFNQENQRIANAISDYNREEANRQTLLAQNRLRLLVLSIITIIALLVVMILVITLRRQQILEKSRIIREKELKIEEDMAQIQVFAEELQSTRNTQSEMARTISELIRDKITIVKICADAYDSIKSEPKTNPRDPFRYLDDDPQKMKSEQMRQFLKALEDFRTDKDLFSLLEESVNKWRDNLMVKLRGACSVEKMNKPKFKEDDFRILMLFYARMPDRTVAFLMGMTCAAIRTRKTRYKERLVQADIDDGAFFVQQLAP